MVDSIDLWNKFTKAFFKQITDLSSENLSMFWRNNPNRTKQYLSPEGVLRKIEQELGLRYFPEYRHFDCIYFSNFESEDFPQIFVEVENDPKKTLESELDKLCSIRAPLKILITLGEWSSKYWRWYPECDKTYTVS